MQSQGFETFGSWDLSDERRVVRQPILRGAVEQHVPGSLLLNSRKSREWCWRAMK